MSKNNVQRKNDTGMKRTATLLITAAILILTGCIGFQNISNQIVENSMTSMTELAVHDENSIHKSLQLYQTRFDGAIKLLERSKQKNIKDLESTLKTIQLALNAEDVWLITKDGETINTQGTQVSEPENPMVKFALNLNEPFYATNEDFGCSDREPYVYAGQPLDDIKIGEYSYTYLVVKVPVALVSELLDIPAYGQTGYSALINTDGTYIASSFRKFEEYKDQNFLDFQRTSEIKSDITMEQIEEKMLERQTFLVLSEAKNGLYAAAYVPMENSSWYYVAAVPFSYFQGQISRLTNIAGIMIFIMVAALMSALFYIYWQNNQKQKADEKYQKDLQEALNLAEQSNRSKTVFLNNMSHDIRTPMNAVMGYTVLAQSHTDDPDLIQEYLRKIAKSFDHLLSLINDVLDMSRIESGKVNINNQPEDLGTIINTIQDIVIKDVQEKNQHLTIDVSKMEHPFVYCDKLRINQVLINTLSNAVKFTPCGGKISLNVSEKPSSRDGYGLYTIQVEDTGIGMSEEFQKEIFEPFTRERTSTVSGIPGTGLGMSITRNIVEMMDGTIEVQSEQDKGTVLTIELELKLQNEQKDLEIMRRLRGIKVLVVDDNTEEARETAQMLDELELRSDWTDSSRSAIGIVTAAKETGRPYRILLVDGTKSIQKGLKSAFEIHQADPNLQIFLLGGQTWKDIEEEAHEAGISGVISKPLTYDRLKYTLAQASGVLNERKEVLSIKKKGKIHAANASKYRLLIVEDNEFNREIAQEILEEAGFKTECVENGKLAVQAVQEHPADYFDAILMDLQMPVMDGYEATRQIRQLPDKQKANRIIIALTANAFAEDRSQVMEAGMNGFVSKPINITDLFKTLSHLLDAKQDD